MTRQYLEPRVIGEMIRGIQEDAAAEERADLTLLSTSAAGKRWAAGYIEGFDLKPYTVESHKDLDALTNRLRLIADNPELADTHNSSAACKLAANNLDLLSGVLEKTFEAAVELGWQRRGAIPASTFLRDKVRTLEALVWDAEGRVARLYQREASALRAIVEEQDKTRAARARIQELENILKELLRLKAIKMAHGETEEYKRDKHIAWNDAWKAINK